MNIIEQIKEFFASRKNEKLARIEEAARKESIKAFVVDFYDAKPIIRFRGVMVYANEDEAVLIDNLRFLRSQYISDCCKGKTLL